MKYAIAILFVLITSGCARQNSPLSDADRTKVEKTVRDWMRGAYQYKILLEESTYRCTLTPGWLMWYGEADQLDGELCVFVGTNGLVEIFVNRTPGVAKVHSPIPRYAGEAKHIAEQELVYRGADLQRNVPEFDVCCRLQFEPFVKNTGRSHYAFTWYALGIPDKEGSFTKGAFYTTDREFFPSARNE